MRKIRFDDVETFFIYVSSFISAESSFVLDNCQHRLVSKYLMPFLKL